MSKPAETSLTDTQHKKRGFSEWVGICMVGGMGLLTASGVVGGLALAYVGIASSSGAFIGGGLTLAAISGYVTGHFSLAIRGMLQPEKSTNALRTPVPKMNMGT